MDNFDFDAWARLAQTAPDKFEQRRRDMIESVISNSGSNSRLRGLQCNIDLERIRARTPMKACLRLSTLMSDAFIKLNNELNAYLWGMASTTGAPPDPGKSAQVIPLIPRRKQRK